MGSLSCTNQVPTSITLNSDAAPSGFGCATVTSSYVDSSIAKSSAVMSFQLGCNGTASSSQTLFLAAPGSATPACTDTTGTLGVVMTSTGTIKNLYVNAGSAGKVAGSGVFTVLKNGSAQAVTCTVGTGTTCNDTSHSFSVAAGDIVKVQFTTQGSETLANVSAGFEKL